jgi:hypothetical protein
MSHHSPLRACCLLSHGAGRGQGLGGNALTLMVACLAPSDNYRYDRMGHACIRACLHACVHVCWDACMRSFVQLTCLHAFMLTCNALIQACCVHTHGADLHSHEHRDENISTLAYAAQASRIRYGTGRHVQATACTQRVPSTTYGLGLTACGKCEGGTASSSLRKTRAQSESAVVSAGASAVASALARARAYHSYLHSVVCTSQPPVLRPFLCLCV